MKDLVDQEFLATFSSLLALKLPVKTSYNLLNVDNQLTVHRQLYERCRLDLITKYGKKTEEGAIMLSEDGAQFMLEDAATFQKEINDLSELEVEVDVVPFSLIDKVEFDCTPYQLTKLIKVVFAE